MTTDASPRTLTSLLALVVLILVGLTLSWCAGSDSTDRATTAADGRTVAREAEERLRTTTIERGAGVDAEAEAGASHILPAGVFVEALVLGPDGDPLADATVELTTLDGNRWGPLPVRRVRSDPDGIARHVGLPAARGLFVVRAVSDGARSEWVGVSLASRVTLRCQESGTLAVRVTGPGAEEAALRVWEWDRRNAFLRSDELPVGADGETRIDVRIGEPLRLRAVTPNSMSAHVELNVDRRTLRTGIDLALRDDPLEVRVARESDGTPVPGLHVHFAGRCVSQEPTDEQGRTTVAWIDPEHAIEVGFGLRTEVLFGAKSVRRTDAGLSFVVERDLADFVAYEVRVVGATNQFPIEAAAVGWHGKIHPLYWPGTPTDADGVSARAGLAGSTFTVVVVAPGYRPAVAPFAPQANVLELELEPGVERSIRVVDSDGRPVSFAQTTFWFAPAHDRQSFQIVMGEDGTATAVLPSKWTARVRAPNSGAFTSAEVVSDGPEGVVLRWIPRPDRLLVGALVGPDGRPLHRPATVTATDENGTVHTVEASTHFELRGVWSMFVTVTATTAEGWTGRYFGQITPELEVRVAPLARVRLVPDDFDGPLPFVDVVAENADGRVRLERVVPEDGAWRVDLPEPGEWRLQVLGDHVHGEAFDVEVAQGGIDQQAAVTLQRYGRLRLRSTGATTEPVVRATVMRAAWESVAAGRDQAHQESIEFANDGGTLLADRCPPGRYSVSATIWDARERPFLLLVPTADVVAGAETVVAAERVAVSKVELQTDDVPASALQGLLVAPTGRLAWMAAHARLPVPVEGDRAWSLVWDGDFDLVDSHSGEIRYHLTVSDQQRQIELRRAD